MKKIINVPSAPVARLLLFVGFCCPVFMHANEEGDTVAYWRFEEGVAGNLVEHPQVDVVLDSSGNGQNLRTWSEGTAPTYAGEVSYDVVPQTGAPNKLGLSFTQHQDIYSEGKTINGTVFEEWTIEASFKAKALGRFQAVVSKDGNPIDGPPPVSIKVYPDGQIEVGLVDGSGTRRQLVSVEPVEAGQWYSVAATATDSVLSLWVKGPNDAAYALQDTLAIDGAFFTYPGVDRVWTIGRAVWKGKLADFFDGMIDEVRISSSVLAPWEFLGADSEAGPALGTLIELSATR